MIIKKYFANTVVTKILNQGGRGISADGKGIQFLQYLLFGETFVNQRDNSNYNTPYKFSGKEKDDEIKYIYFGARYYDSDMSVWLSVDPMSDGRPGITPYHYCQNNPVGRIDPTGAWDDWFRNNETGEIQWFPREGKQGETETIDGEKWTNLGSELLKFEGDKLSYFWQTKNDKGKLILNKESYDAVSGKPTESGNNLTFDYSKESQNTSGGTLPEGLWYVQKSKVQNYDDISTIDKLKGVFGRGTFRGGTYSWGENRWWLTPLTAKAENRDMYSFTIHGGGAWGSKGCIDLTHNLPIFTSTFLNVASSENVVLWVDYSKISTLTIQKGQWGW